MRGWLRRRRERVERIEAEAEELVRLLGGDAYGEARWREQTTSSRAMAQEWNLIAFAKACEMGLEGIISKRVGSIYWSGRCRNWTKVRNPAFQRS